MAPTAASSMISQPPKTPAMSGSDVIVIALENIFSAPSRANDREPDTLRRLTHLHGQALPQGLYATFSAALHPVAKMQMSIPCPELLSECRFETIPPAQIVVKGFSRRRRLAVDCSFPSRVNLLKSKLASISATLSRPKIHRATGRARVPERPHLCSGGAANALVPCARCRRCEPSG